MVVPRAARRLFACERAGRAFVGVLVGWRCAWCFMGAGWLPRVLVGAWVVSRERACLRDVHGWVGDVEGVALLEELFGFECGGDAPDDGRPCQRVFAACGDGEELGGELWCGYWLCHVFAVWAGVAECGVLGGGSDSLSAAVGFECECGGDVADLLVAEVWFACGGGFTRSVTALVCAVARFRACFCVRGRFCAALFVQVVGVLVPGREYGVV